MWRALKTILKTVVYLIVIFCGLSLFSTAFAQRSMPGMGVAAALCLLGLLGFVAMFWELRGFGRVMFVLSLLVVLVGGGAFLFIPRPMAPPPTHVVSPAERPAILKRVEATATGAANNAVGEYRRPEHAINKARAVASLSSVSSQLRTLQRTARAGDATTIKETARSASVSDSVTEKVAPAVAAAVSEAVSEGVPADAANEAAAHGLDKAATAPSEVDRLLDGLKSANIAHNLPEKLDYGRTFTVKLELSANKTPEELAGMIHGPGPTETATVKISNEMDARLTGDGFQITAISKERQAVSANGTHWSWDIKPRESGQQNLHITLDAVLKVDNQETTHTITTFDKTIAVDVVWSDATLSFLGKNWQWLCTTIVIPFVVWIGKKIFKG